MSRTKWTFGHRRGWYQLTLGWSTHIVSLRKRTVSFVKAPLRWKIGFAYCCFIWMFLQSHVCAEFDTTALLKLSLCWTSAWDLKAVTTCWILWQLAWRPIVVQYATYTFVMWKLETSHTVSGLFSEVRGILCPVVKHLQWTIHSDFYYVKQSIVLNHVFNVVCNVPWWQWQFVYNWTNEQHCKYCISPEFLFHFIVRCNVMEEHQVTMSVWPWSFFIPLPFCRLQVSVLQKTHFKLPSGDRKWLVRKGNTTTSHIQISLCFCVPRRRFSLLQLALLFYI